MSGRLAHPSWDRLFATAQGQDGLFTTRQAAEAGYSSPLLDKYLKNGKVKRVRRGVYRIVHYPPGEHEDLVAIWLWSARQGVFSHETALALHGLSDVMPGHLHLTLPPAWRGRRLRIPKSLTLAYGTVPKSERSWVGPLPVTTVPRTLHDCVAASLAPDLLEQAVAQARERGLITPRDADRLLPPEVNE